MDGATHCIDLAEKKQLALICELKTVVRMKIGVPLKRFEAVVGKLRHASIRIPTGKYLFGPVEKIPSVRPQITHWGRYP